jgi:hypothetical protein
MQTQILYQQQNHVPKGNNNWVHDIDNFAWAHQHLNIHQSMSVDILHQLYKGIAENVIKWVREILDELYTGKRQGNNLAGSSTITHLSGTAQLDARFNLVPPFQNIKHFSHFSQV